MLKNIKKILGISLIMLLIFSTFVQFQCFAAEADVSTVISNMKNVNQTSDVTSGNGGITKVLNMIIGLLQIAGSGIALIMVTWMGVKYLLSSVEDKADVKKQAVPIVIGAILLFGAVNLMAALEEFASNTLNQ